MLGRRHRIAKGGVHHHHTAGCGLGDIHIVDTDAGAPDDLQIGGRRQDFRRDLGGGTDRQPVIIAQNLDQFLGRQPGAEINIKPPVFQNGYGGFTQLVADQYFWHGLFSPFIECHQVLKWSLAIAAKAQSIHGSRALRSSASTVGPPHNRRPAGASR